mgnify:CR=1 FL=1
MYCHLDSLGGNRYRVRVTPEGWQPWGKGWTVEDTTGELGRFEMTSDGSAALARVEALTEARRRFPEAR